jgi:hypothetical protein
MKKWHFNKKLWLVTNVGNKMLTFIDHKLRDIKQTHNKL